MKSSPNSLTIAQYTRTAIIIVHTEDVTNLRLALVAEGFEVRENRYSYSEEEKGYSPIIRCLLNHASVWREIAASGIPALVVEADFVPCVGFGDQSVPFPESQTDRCWGWLYMTGPTVYEWRESKARGHSASPVATLICPGVAVSLTEYAKTVLARDPRKYFPWDAGARYFVQQNGYPSFLSFRNLGEHGGIPNPEHKNAGLRASHRADALASRLHFLPQYAQGSRVRFLRERLIGKFWGIGRLCCGRYLPWKTIKETKQWSAKISLIWFSAKRFLVIW